MRKDNAVRARTTINSIRSRSPLPDPEPGASGRVYRPAAILVAVFLLALNLRPAVTSIGVVLKDIQGSTGMSATLAAAEVAAPVWCFAAGGALAWSARVRWGTRRTVAGALAVLAVALLARIVAGPQVLLGGTIVACLSIAVLGTLLPAIVHTAPPRQWATLTGCYVAALGAGSGIGALLTSPVADAISWQAAAGGWALLAGAGWLAWRVAARQMPEPPVTGRPARVSPLRLRPIGTAWALTIHFGLTSGLTFAIMGWLPGILRDRAAVPPQAVGWLFTLAMVLGVPIALRVPRWARRAGRQSSLAVALAAPTGLAVLGLLIAPAAAPWLWVAGLGLGMPSVSLGLVLISLRSEPRTDTAAALSSMVQGAGYALSGAVALGIGLLYGATLSWHWPLIGLLIVLCGQMGSGVLAGRSVTIHAPSAEPFIAVPTPRTPSRLS